MIGAAMPISLKSLLPKRASEPQDSSPGKFRNHDYILLRSGLHAQISTPARVLFLRIKEGEQMPVFSQASVLGRGVSEGVQLDPDYRGPACATIGSSQYGKTRFLVGRAVASVVRKNHGFQPPPSSRLYFGCKSSAYERDCLVHSLPAGMEPG
jgi:hypothetical protein